MAATKAPVLIATRETPVVVASANMKSIHLVPLLNASSRAGLLHDVELIKKLRPSKNMLGKLYGQPPDPHHS